MRDVGSPDTHKCFRRLTGSQRTPGIRGVTVTVLGAILGVCVVICETNCIVMCMRPEMAIKFRFTKWNRYLVVGREQ